MIRLAVATNAKTYDRIRSPLADRGIEVVHVPASGRTIDLQDPDLPAVDVGFVYPPRLMEGGAIEAALDVPWVNGREAVLISRNKGGVIARLAAAGVSVPRTVMISNPVDREQLTQAIDAIGWPIVVKPNSTTRGVGVAKAIDRDSLDGIIDYLDLVHDYRATGDRSYLLQEYLPDATDYRVMIVDGEYAGAVERQLPERAADAGHWKHNVHRGAIARAIDLPDEHRRIAERTAAVLGIDYLGVDLLETTDGVVVNETNARPTIDAETKYEPWFYDRLAALIERTADAEIA